MESFILDKILLPKGSQMGKYTIKIPVSWGAEIIKDYPEHGKKLLMPFEEIQQIVKTHKEFIITENHVEMGTRDKFAIIVNPIGKIKNLKTNPKKRTGRGIAYINKNKLNDFYANMLLRGGVIGVSIGGFVGKFGPGGVHKNENYDATQLNTKVHHAAMVTVGIARCPNNICGFNIQEAFLDSTKTLQSCVSEKIPIISKEHSDWTQAHKTVAAFNDCRQKMGMDESFEFPKSTPMEFIEYYEFLISENTISREPCVHDFYKEFQDAWNSIDGVGIIKEKEHLLDINIKPNLNKNKVENKLAEKLKIEDLMASIAMLQAENKSLKDAKLKDADGMVESLKAENQKLKDNFATLAKTIDNFQSAEMEAIKKTLIDSGKYKQEELDKLDYKNLKDTFETAKRFLDLQNLQVIAPPPMQFVPQQFAPVNQAQLYNQPIPVAPSVISGVPQPQVPGQQPGYYDARGQPLVSPQPQGQQRGGNRQFSMPAVMPGSVPTPAELYDKNNPRWKETNGEDPDDPRGVY